MARPTKTTVDYFPHIVNKGKTLFILEENYGNDGYAFWFKILELLASTKNHYYDCNNSTNWQFLLAKTRVSEDIANKILNLLSELDAIDGKLWSKKIIFSQNFIDNIQDVYKRRGVNVITKEDIMSLCKQKPLQSDEDVNKKPQTKLNKTKLNKTKLNKTKLNKTKLNKTKFFLSDSDEYRLAKLLLDLILLRNPEYKKPNLQFWTKHIDYMIRIDKRKPEDIEYMINWCQQDNFWQSNILSTEKLRRQYDQLFLKIKSEIDKKKENSGFNGLDKFAKKHGVKL